MMSPFTLNIYVVAADFAALPVIFCILFIHVFNIRSIVAYVFLGLVAGSMAALTVMEAKSPAYFILACGLCGAASALMYHVMTMRIVRVVGESARGKQKS